MTDPKLDWNSINHCNCPGMTFATPNTNHPLVYPVCHALSRASISHLYIFAPNVPNPSAVGVMVVPNTVVGVIRLLP